MATWEGPRLVAQEADRDVTAQAELRQLVERTRAGMIAPLVTGGRVLGLLAIGQPAVGHYGPEELLLVGTIAQQSATHVLTARLGQELLRTREVELSQLFSTFLVHDLKNLGTALSLVGQNLPHRYTDEQFRNDARHVITETIDKIREMTQKVALLGQPQPTLEAADLNDVARESVAMLNGSLSVPVQCELEPLPPIMLDRRQLRSVFTNLLLNAQEATRAVTLPETGADRVIRLRTHHRDGWAVLLISDTGCGISREFLEQHLFQPFRSTKPGGLGIGLYQCRKIVEAHGGRISVDSHTGKGTSVTVALPAHGR
jgi:signal transduction histidine kinase